MQLIQFFPWVNCGWAALRTGPEPNTPSSFSSVSSSPLLCFSLVSLRPNTAILHSPFLVATASSFLRSHATQSHLRFIFPSPSTLTARSDGKGVQKDNFKKLPSGAAFLSLRSFDRYSAAIFFRPTRSNSIASPSTKLPSSSSAHSFDRSCGKKTARSMSDKGGEEGNTGLTEPTVGFVDTLQEQWRKTKEHAETYPYVWGSYILVYSGLSVYLTWRYRKLRRTEDRVRVLQERLKKLVEADEAKKPPSGQ